MVAERRRRRRAPARAAAASESALRAAVGALVLAAPLLVAGRPGWAVVVLGLVTTAALALAAFRDAPVAADSGSRAMFAALGLGLGWTVLQAMPLPAGLTRALTPATMADVDASARLLGESPPLFRAMSVSPTATAAAVVAGATLLGAALLSSVLGASGRSRDVARAAGLAGILVAIVTLAHEAVGAERVYGLYELPWRPAILSPLVNENQLAGFLAMTVPVQLGLALEADTQPTRVAWALSAAFTTALTVLVVSRGGLVGLGVGIATFALLLWRARRNEGAPALRRSQLVAVLASAMLAVGTAGFAIQDALLGDWGRTTLDKVRSAIEGLDLLVGRAWWGIGRGSYSEAFVALRSVGDRAEYPENLPIQWIVEWGALVGAAILILFAIAWIAAARAATSPVRVGAVAATTSIVVHDLVDFALEQPGSAIVAIALLAGALARPRPAGAMAPAGRPRAISTALAVGLGLVTVTIGPGIERSRVRVVAARLGALAAAGDRDGFREAAATALRNHPSEPSIPLFVGYEAARYGDGTALRWINRAMSISPSWPAPHLLAARVLAMRRASAQAWLEIREVERASAFAGIAEACVLLTAYPVASEPLGAFVEEPGGERFLDHLVASCSGAPAEVRLELDGVLEASGLSGPVLRSAQRSVAAGDYAAALARLEGADPYDAPTALCRARALSGLGRHDDAIAALREARPADDGERRAVLEAIADAQTSAGDAEGMRETMSVVRGASRSARLAADALVYLGDLEQRLGNAGRAMQAYEQAERLADASAGLARVAALSEELGNLRRAYQAHVELCRRRGEATCPAADRLAGTAEGGP